MVPMTADKNRPPAEPGPASDGHNEAPGIFDSETLFGDSDVVQIRHKGFTYTLRKTRLDKLILTK